MPPPTIHQLQRHVTKVNALQSAVLHTADRTDPAVRDAAFRRATIRRLSSHT